MKLELRAYPLPDKNGQQRPCALNSPDASMIWLHIGSQYMDVTKFMLADKRNFEDFVNWIEQNMSYEFQNGKDYVQSAIKEALGIQEQ